ncbi:MAG: N-acetyl-gamma-glutamyl-phosphate reductase [Candidatus Nezhaarchaeota archaeon]|nr:N-acetyl-gamma-glutamyl-phosphate reductase [Candidatus Nezhaarchaeota archaeon]MCX8141498.1 N-acetyl-gamma-glutamyl-phosphate reductase [Candidatus Nezhaarchaeota archaeon]MDW8049765.1 N-acetyl-gamma-glutamyl-phosphate reductase [Nitrososphaerota archaeon]
MKKRVGIVGASGFVGGELLRLLLYHPYAEVKAAISRRYAGEYVFRVHANLRKLTDLVFSPLNVKRLTEECDVAFLAVPHTQSAKLTAQLVEVGIRVIDLSADFRFKDPKLYKAWYNWEHPFPELLQEAVYGLPELHRDEIRRAKIIACPGCMPTAAILASAPLAKRGIMDPDHVVVDVKIGSSGAGTAPSMSTLHAERFGVVRPYSPTGHRHTGEIEQELTALVGKPVKVAMSAHAVNIVRGILATCHVYTTDKIDLIDLWRMYRSMYGNEPFVRVVRDKRGVYRLPDPKVVIGTNFCDVGFEVDKRINRVVAFGAIDNLMKGAAGQAVQCFNIAIGVDERTGLDFPGFHPI